MRLILEQIDGAAKQAPSSNPISGNKNAGELHGVALDRRCSDTVHISEPIAEALRFALSKLSPTTDPKVTP